jgi:hypothetical protein
MKMGLIAGAALLAFAAPAAAQSPNWVSWGERDGQSLAYDTNSVNWNTVKALFNPPTTRTTSLGAPVTLSAMLESISVHCGAGLFIENRNVGYDANGTAVFNTPTPSQAQPITGGAPAAIKTQFCGG